MRKVCVNGIPGRVPVFGNNVIYFDKFVESLKNLFDDPTSGVSISVFIFAIFSEIGAITNSGLTLKFVGCL